MTYTHIVEDKTSTDNAWKKELFLFTQLLFGVF